jgi:hypothetical protein
VHGDAFEVVIREVVGELRGVEVRDRQALARAGDCHAGRRVHVHHAMRVLDMTVDRRVGRKAGRIDRPLRRADDMALEIDFDEIRGLHFAVVQAEGVDQSCD